MIAESLNKIFDMIFQVPMNQDDNCNYYIIDLGSKFSSMCTLFK